MQAIRVLRAQSRPASPSPAPFVSADGLAHGSSTATEDVNTQRSGNPIARIQNLTLSSLAKRAIPTPPPSSPSPTPSAIVQDGTYLNTLGLKLNEAATKVLAMPAANGSNGADVWKGRRAIPPGRGRMFAALIETELDASQGNANLRHAILRLLPRSLHVLVSNISAQVSQLLPVPGYVPVGLHTSLHPATTHALALAQCCSEILETFATYRLGNATPDMADIRSHLETLISRITSPLLSQLQADMHVLLEPLSQPAGLTNSPSGFAGSKKEEKPVKPHPAVVTLAQNMPLVARALKRYTFDTCVATQTSLANFHINALWHTMIHLAHRTPTLPPPEPATLLNGIAHKSSLHSLAQALTPPGSPALKMRKISPPASPPVRKRLALPNSPLVNTLTLTSDSPPKSAMRLNRRPSSGSLDDSRSSSPDTKVPPISLPRAQVQFHRASVSSSVGHSSSLWLASLSTDARALWDILSSRDVLRPIEGSLPREAVDETYERLAAFRDWLVGGAGGNGGIGKLLNTVPEEVPLLVVLPVLLGEAWIDYSAPKSSHDASSFPGVWRLLGYENEEAYRRTAACGFRRADECETLFGSAVVNRLSGSAEWVHNVIGWLRGRIEISG